jgi:hypothetical protein
MSFFKSGLRERLDFRDLTILGQQSKQKLFIVWISGFSLSC